MAAVARQGAASWVRRTQGVGTGRPCGRIVSGGPVSAGAAGPVGLTSRLIRRVASTPFVATTLKRLPMQMPCSEGSGRRRAGLAPRARRSSASRSARGGSGGMVATWPSPPMKVMTCSSSAASGLSASQPLGHHSRRKRAACEGRAAVRRASDNQMFEFLRNQPKFEWVNGKVLLHSCLVLYGDDYAQQILLPRACFERRPRLPSPPHHGATSNRR